MQERNSIMEELQVEEFVYRVLENEALREELVASPETVIAREDLTPKVAQVVLRLVPHLAMYKFSSSSGSWWCYTC